MLKDYAAIIPRKLGLSRRPWMKQKEIDLILATIRSVRPLKCLEWGSGYSSLYFPAYLPAGAGWLSLEHEPVWAREVTRLNERDNVQIVDVAPNNPEWKDDGTYEDFKDYVEAPGGQQFDLIVVDGRARTECVRKGLSLLSDQGVIILHDANREKYRPAFESLPHTALFTDGRSGYGGMWIGSRQPLPNRLNVAFQQKVWACHRRLSKLFSFRPSR